MLKASAASNIAEQSAPMITEQYVTRRITEAAEKGYQSTYVWANNPEEVEALLNEGGYEYEVIQVDGTRKQYEVRW